MAYLTKDAILAVQDIPTQVVAVPEWGGDVCVMGMTGIDRDALEAGMIVQKGKNRTINMANLRARMVQKCVVDPETHGRLFSEADIAALGHKSAIALERVFDVARNLSGMSDDDVEELTEDLKADQNDGSGSDSP